MNTSSTDDNYGYCLYYPEGAGYLYISRLGNGSEAAADLVWSCVKGVKQDDTRVYVRKKTYSASISYPGYDAERGHQHHRAEVLLYRAHPRIPRLIDWTYYRPLRLTSDEFKDFESSSMIFEYCNNGTLATLIRHYINSKRGGNYHMIPEAFIWSAMGELIGVMNFLHQCRPGIFHWDAVASNIFLHRVHDQQPLPDCYLGDFGKAIFMEPYTAWTATGKVIDARRADPRVVDFRNIMVLIKRMMTLGPGPVVTPGGHGIDDSRLRADFDTLQDNHVPNAHWHYLRDRAITNPGAPAINHDWYHTGDPGPEDWQREHINEGPFYSPLLFRTIRQFEQRLDDVEQSKEKPDWEYLAKAMYAKRDKYMHFANANEQVTYPDLDQFWLKIIDGRGIRMWEPADHRRPTFFKKEDLQDLTTRNIPSGPWKVAKVDKQTYEVKAISKETYRCFWPYSDEIQRAPYNVHKRRDSEVSLTRSERATSVLNRGNL